MDPKTRILSDEQYNKLIKDLVTSIDNPDKGFFGPGSMYWKVARENILGLGGVAALLLQIAHPQVAAGVDEHSNFEEDPQSRLEQTFRYVHRITFGTVDEAVETAQKVHRMHKKVKGSIPEEVDSFEKGSSYHANRIDLLIWVHATLIDSALKSYEAFVEPLSYEQKESYYQQSKIFAMLFGIPEDALPEDLHEFENYYRKQIRSVLGTGDQGRRLGDTIINQTGMLSPFVTLLTSGLIPDHRLRKIFKLPWNYFLKILFKLITTIVRILLPIIPPSLRYVKKYRKRLENLEGKEAVPTYLDQLFKELPAPFDALGIIRRLLRPIHSPM